MDKSFLYIGPDCKPKICHQQIKDLIIPIKGYSYYEYTKQMTKMPNVPQLWKKIVKEAPKGSKSVDFSRHQVTYHITAYKEFQEFPLDSTHFNGEPKVLVFDKDMHSQWMVIDMLSSMKEGEKSFFIFMRTMEPPFLNEFVILEVLKVKDLANCKTFADIKFIVQEDRSFAKYMFNDQKFDDAIMVYHKTLEMLKSVSTNGTAEEAEKKELMVQILTNIAVCFNAKPEPRKTLHIIRVIENFITIEKNSKLLFLKGKSLRLLGMFKIAGDILTKAHLLERKSNEILIEIDQLKEDVEEFNAFERQFAF